MDKKEILSRAKNEPDEMENSILEKSLGISTIIIPLLCLFFISIRIIKSNYIISDLIVLVLSQLLIQEIYRYIRLKNKKILFLILIILIFTLLFLINFLKEVNYEGFISFKK